MKGLPFLLFAIVSTSMLRAEVISVEVMATTPFSAGKVFGKVGAYEVVRGRIHFAVDARTMENRSIVDLHLAATNSSGKVEFSSDFVVLRPVDAAHRRPSVLLEVLNRGTSEEERFFMSLVGDKLLDLPELTKARIEDGFVFEQGFTLAYLGWEVNPGIGTMKMVSPEVAVTGLVRAQIITDESDAKSTEQTFGFLGQPCPTQKVKPQSRLLVKSSFDDPGHDVPTDEWTFTSIPGKASGDKPSCGVRLLKGSFLANHLYEPIYPAGNTPVAGLSFAAFRDFASYLKHGTVSSPIQRSVSFPGTITPRVLGYGYSQSARYLRSFLGSGFNSDEAGRIVFDGMFIASAGAGGGSFNHRYALPGQAGNSVLSDLRPVDMFPFTDVEETDPITHARGSLLVRAQATHTVPRIITTFSSTEYWARYASLVTTSPDGKRDLPLHPNHRIYFLAGTSHAIGTFPPTKTTRRGAGKLEQYSNFANAGPVFRALLLDLDDWVSRGTEPPASVYPHLIDRTLVARSAVEFPRVPGFMFPAFMPKTWRVNYGSRFTSEGIIAEPPLVGPEYSVLVPQVDRDGIDLGGIRLPHAAVPVATFTGWNRELPSLPEFQYLAGLAGSFVPLARSAKEQTTTGDARRSLADRYRSREVYLDQVRQEAQSLVSRRLLLDRDVDEQVSLAIKRWDFVMTNPGKQP